MVGLPSNIPGTEFGKTVALSGDGKLLAVGMTCDQSSASGINGPEITSNPLNCSGSVRIYRSGDNGGWKQEAFIKASSPHAGDQFGFSLALSQDASTLVVGAPGDPQNARGIDAPTTDVSLSNSGAAYIYRRSTNGAWTQDAFVKASNPDTIDGFGASVAVSDNGVAAVGATREASGAKGINGAQDNSSEDTGAVYVLRRELSGKWTQQAYVKASNTLADALFGVSVSLSSDGQTLAVGAMFECGVAVGVNGDQSKFAAYDTGAVYVFQGHNGQDWEQTTYIKASNPNASDEFGRSVALSPDGNTLGVGAISEASASPGVNGVQTDNSLAGAGAAYLFRRMGTTWAQVSYIKSSSPGKGDSFGMGLSLSRDGSTLAVGAPQRDSGIGAAYLFAL